MHRRERRNMKRRPASAVFWHVPLTALYYHSIIESAKYMDARKEQLLRFIIEQYVETAEPIGSSLLAEKSGFGVSGATLRNEMRELEEMGLLTHPHTSAGRIPTEAGYRYYIQHIMRPSHPSKRMGHELEQIAGKESKKIERLKATARLIAKETKNAVIVAWNNDSLYYTGLSHLFAQPEFQNVTLTINISAVFDRFEQRLDDIYDAVEPDETKILIGAENPMGNECGTVVVRDSRNNLFAIVGPIRKDYGEQAGLVEFLREII